MLRLQIPFASATAFLVLFLSGSIGAEEPKPKPAFTYKLTKKEWKAVKMIAADQGVCYVSLIKGAFAGGGGKVQIEKRDDGFYWLTGQSQQEELGVQATALKWLPGQAKKLKTSDHRWRAGKDPVKIFPRLSGLCFVTSIGGGFAGYGEELSLDVDDQEMWTLSGRSQQEGLEIGALGLRWDGK